MLWFKLPNTYKFEIKNHNFIIKTGLYSTTNGPRINLQGEQLLTVNGK